MKSYFKNLSVVLSTIFFSSILFFTTPNVYGIWPTDGKPIVCSVGTTCSNGNLLQCNGIFRCYADAGKSIMCDNKMTVCPPDEE